MPSYRALKSSSTARTPRISQQVSFTEESTSPSCVQKAGARSDIQAVAEGPADRRDAARPRFGCSKLHSPAGHREPDVYRSVSLRAPILWAVINDYVKPFGVKPDHQAENLAMAISLVASTGGIGLFPLYSQKSVAENRRQPTATRRTANGRPGHRL